MFKKVALIFIVCLTQAYSQVLIITHAYNRPDFIEWQYKTFNKFLSDDYRFVVFNDAPKGPTHDAIVEMCSHLGIECIPIPQELHDREYNEDEMAYSIFSRRHTNGIQFSLETLGYAHKGPLVFIDSDMFLIRPLSFAKMVEDVEIAAVFRVSSGAISYFWPGLNVLAMDRLPDNTTLQYYCGKVDGYFVDSGGLTHNYLKAHPELRIKELNQVFSYQIFCSDKYGNYDDMHSFTPDPLISNSFKVRKLKKMGFNNREILFILKGPDTINFAGDNHFLHFRNACGWNGQPNEFYNQKKTVLFSEFIKSILY